MGSGWTRNGFVYLLILVAAAALFFSLFPQRQESNIVDISQVALWIKEGKAKSVEIQGETVTVVLKDDSQTYIANKNVDTPFDALMTGLGVAPEQLTEPALVVLVKPPAEMGNWLAFLGGVLPLLFIGGLFFFLMRQAQGSNSQAMSFGKSKARMFTGDKPTVTFQDIAGCDEAKEELKEVVEFLKDCLLYTSRCV